MAVIEFIIAMLITAVFIYKLKPKIHFLVLGYFFFFINLLFQIPLKYIIEIIEEQFGTVSTIPILLLVTLGIIITQITKYLSLSKYLKTKSYKNGVLFGLGWATIDSIDAFKLVFIGMLSSTTHILIPNSLFLNPSYNLLEFMYFFIINVSLTTLIIFSVIKKTYFFLLFAILYAIIIYIGIPYISQPAQNIIIITTLIFSIMLIFFHKHFE